MEKKVGIVTSYLDFDKNYGGILQAYALSLQVKKLGYNPYIMPYIFSYITKKEDENFKVKKILRRCYLEIKKIINPNLKFQDQMHEMMMKFVNTKLPVLSSKKISLNEMQNISYEFYAFISGSDQVWSTRNQKNQCDPGMFLRFVPPKVKRIAYAPSLGATTEMSERTAIEFRDSLNKYNSISVREKSGQSLIKKIVKINVPIVLDPTLLIERKDWENFMEIPHNLPKEYILLYRFGTIENNNKKIEEIRKKLNLPVIELPSSAISQNSLYIKRYDINPAQFLGLIKNAKLVCTDSFHATVFSIIMKTPFITLYRQSPYEKMNMNGRVEDLLELTELKKCLVKPEDEVLYENIFNIDFENAHFRIDEKRKDSLMFLKSALAE